MGMGMGMGMEKKKKKVILMGMGMGGKKMPLYISAIHKINYELLVVIVINTQI